MIVSETLARCCCVFVFFYLTSPITIACHFFFMLLTYIWNTRKSNKYGCKNVNLFYLPWLDPGSSGGQDHSHERGGISPVARYPCCPQLQGRFLELCSQSSLAGGNLCQNLFYPQKSTNNFRVIFSYNRLLMSVGLFHFQQATFRRIIFFYYRLLMLVGLFFSLQQTTYVNIIIFFCNRLLLLVESFFPTRDYLCQQNYFFLQQSTYVVLFGWI